MARIRSVHPQLWTDEAFVSLSMPARLFMIGLWNEADDYGLFEWKPVTLKMRLAPADNIDAPAIMAELAVAKFIIRFERDGSPYGVIKKFRKWQRPQKPSAPIIPLDDWIKTTIALVENKNDSPPAPLQDHSGSPTGIGNPMEDGGYRKEEEAASSLRSDAAAAPRESAGEEISLHSAEHLCRQALGDASPVDPVIGPMMPVLKEFGVPRTTEILRAEAMRPRTRPIRTWKVWADVVRERVPDYAPGQPRASPSGKPDMYAALEESKRILAARQGLNA